MDLLEKCIGHNIQQSMPSCVPTFTHSPSVKIVPSQIKGSASAEISRLGIGPIRPPRSRPQRNKPFESMKCS